MDPDVACQAARVRLMSLAAMIGAGGIPRPGQVARALAPIADRIVGDGGAAPAPDGAVVSREDCPRKPKRRASRVKRVFH